MILVAFCSIVNAQNAVILRCEADSDERKTRLIKSLGEGLMPLIENGKVQLWKDPNKVEPMSYSEIIAIEQNWKKGLMNVNDLYIFEIWSVFGKELEIETRGLMFAYTSTSTQINFGYVDLDQSREALNEISLEADRYGCNNERALNKLYKRAYAYSIQSFGGKALSTSQKRKVEKNFFKKHLYKPPDIPECTSKEMLFAFDYGDSSFPEGMWRSLDFLLDDFPLIWLNATGIEDEMMNESVTVEEVRILEVWTLRNGSYRKNLKELQILFNDQRMLNLSPSEMRALPYRLYGLDFYQLIKNRGADGRLVKVNSELLSAEEGERFLKELKTLNQNKI